MMGATSKVASSKVALSNVRMEEEAPAEEEKKDSVLPGMAALSKHTPAAMLRPLGWAALAGHIGQPGWG